MCWMASAVAVTATGATGALYRSRPDAGEVSALQHQQVELPSGFVLTAMAGQSVTYRGRWYLVGAGTDNLMLDERWRAMLVGIRPPTGVPTIAAGAGTGLTVTTCVGYVSFYDVLTGERSPLSGGSASISLSNKNVAWSGLPTSSLDARVTHIELWRSVDGGSPRLVTRRRLGTSSATENVATLVLGEAFGDTFSRMPRGSTCTIYRDRLAVAGVGEHPDTLYLSNVGYPERYGNLSFRTRRGEPIVAVVGTRDALLALCPNKAYVLRGYTAADMVFDDVDDFGTLNTVSCTVIDNYVLGWDSFGPWLFNGGFHRIGEEREREWSRVYEAFDAEYDAAFAVVNPNDRSFRLYVSGASCSFAVAHNVPPRGTTYPYTIAWVCSYDQLVPQISGGMSQPPWGYDAMARATHSVATLTKYGGKRRVFALGGADGKVRLEDTSAADDDGDAYGKMLTVRTGHWTFGDPGGDFQEGKAIVRLWSHVLCPHNTWTLYVRGGDEEVCWEEGGFDPMYPDNVNLFFKHDVPVGNLDPDAIDGAEVQADSDFTYAERTVVLHPVEGVEGRGYTLEYRCIEPRRWRLAGTSGQWGWGNADVRPPVQNLALGDGGAGGCGASGGDGGAGPNPNGLYALLPAFGSAYYEYNPNFVGERFQASTFSPAVNTTFTLFKRVAAAPTLVYEPGSSHIRSAVEPDETATGVSALPATDISTPSETDTPVSSCVTDDGSVFISYGACGHDALNDTHAKVFKISPGGAVTQEALPTVLYGTQTIAGTDIGGLVLVARGNDVYACTTYSLDPSSSRAPVPALLHRASDGTWSQILTDTSESFDSSIAPPGTANWDANFGATCGILSPLDNKVYFGGNTWRGLPAPAGGPGTPTNEGVSITGPFAGAIVSIDADGNVALEHHWINTTPGAANKPSVVWGLLADDTQMLYVYSGWGPVSGVAPVLNALLVGRYTLGGGWEDGINALVPNNVAAAAVWGQNGYVFVAPADGTSGLLKGSWAVPAAPFAVASATSYAWLAPSYIGAMPVQVLVVNE